MIGLPSSIMFQRRRAKEKTLKTESMHNSMELHIKQRAELAEQVISVAEASSENYASSYSDIAYYAHLSGQLMGIIKGICLDLDDKGIERLKRVYLSQVPNTNLKGEEEC